MYCDPTFSHERENPRFARGSFSRICLVANQTLAYSFNNFTGLDKANSHKLFNANQFIFFKSRKNVFANKTGLQEMFRVFYELFIIILHNEY